MILKDLFEAKQANFGKMQQAIYAYVLKNMKLPKEIKSEAQELASETDTFWVSEFDEALAAIERDMNYTPGVNMETMMRRKHDDNVEEAISLAIEAVSQKIVNHFGHAANHAPGFKPVQLEIIDFNDPTTADVKRIIRASV